MRVWGCWVMFWLWVERGVVRGCPVCYTRTGVLVRAGILDGTFGRTVLLTVLPFAVFGALVAWIYYRLPMPSAEGQR